MAHSDVGPVDAFIRSASSFVGSIVLPLFIIGMVAYLLFSRSGPERLSRLLTPFGSVKLLGQEIVLNRAAEFSDSAEATFRRYRAQTKQRYDALVNEFEIQKLHRRLIDSILVPAIGGLDPDGELRSTIHVGDILFAESYYQLIPYFPLPKSLKGGDGRSLSIRYGIVGRTWRQEKPFGVGNLKMDKDDLIDNWGMTATEAEKAKELRPALIAVPIKASTGMLIAVLFADSKKADAFGATEQARADLFATIDAGVRSTGLTQALTKLVGELPNRPLIPMLGQGGT